ncbi:MAG TPA: O-antigen ligase family protein [Thermodesulfobacteriota bacterium]|nr:O-antigen ligase family protein [Thermodesulfobacteriota bacterium]
MGWTKNAIVPGPKGEILPLSDSIIVWSTIAVLVLAPIVRGAVDPVYICLVAAVLATSLFLFLFNVIQREGQTIKFSGLELPLFCLLLLGILSYFSSAYPENTERKLGFFLLCFVLFFLVQNFFSDRNRVIIFSFAVVASGIALSLFGLFKYAITMGTPAWKEGLSSTYVNRNHFAGFLELCLPLALGLILYVTDKGKKAILSYGIALMVIALVLSLSRGGWIGAVLSLFFMAFLAKKKGLLSKRMWVVSAVVFILFCTSLVGLNSISERLSTFGQFLKDPINFETRLRVWRGTMQIIQNHPLLGTGLGTFAYSFPPFRTAGITNRYTYAHNDFLHFTSELGLLFLPLFLWLIFSASRAGISIFFNTKSALKRGISLGCTVGVLAIIVHSVFDFNLQIPANALLFFSYLGMIGGLKKSYE